MADTIRFKNTSEHTVTLHAVGLSDVGPGEEIDVPLVLCAPSRGDGGARKPSPIECVAPQMKPVDPTDLKVWTGVPKPVKAESKIVSVNNNKLPTESAGVKALREKLDAKKAAEAAAAAKAGVPKA